MTDIMGQLKRNRRQMAVTMEKDRQRRAAMEAAKAGHGKPSSGQTPGRMKTTVVDERGEVSCPHCGARNSFTVKRTGKAKMAGAMFGGVGIALMPKRLKCNGCGKNLRRG